MSRLRTMLALLAAILGFSAAAVAQDVTVRAEVESTEVYIGEPFVFQVIVEGSVRPQPATLPEIPGVFIEDLGSSESSSTRLTIFNGRQTRTESIITRLSWLLTPTQAGSFEIPPLQVEVNGQIHVTQGITIQTLEPRESEDVKLRFTLDRSSPYVGEAVPVTLTLYFRRDLRNLRVTVPDAQGALEITPLPPANIDNTDLRTGRAAQIELNGRAAIGLLSEQVYLGDRYNALTLDLLVTPRSDGSVALGPATAAMDIVVGRRRPTSLMDEMMNLDRAVTERFVTPSDVVDLAVRSLPSEGRPANFGGIVGQYRIDAFAKPTTVNVGDPITLTMVVRGPAPIEDAPVPDLETQPDFTDAFKLATGGPPVRFENGAKVIERTVRARRADVEGIPPVGFWTFDPIGESYVRVESRPIKLDVAATNMVTLADATGDIPGAPAAPLESRRAGLAANRVGERVLAPQGFVLGAAWREPASLIALGAPAAIGLGALGLGALRRRGPGDHRAKASKSALRRAESALRPSGEQPITAAEVSRIVRTYIADRFHRPAAGITSADCVSLVRSASEEHASAMRELLERCDVARFGGDEHEASRLRDEAIALLRRLESAIGRRARMGRSVA